MTLAQRDTPDAPESLIRDLLVEADALLHEVEALVEAVEARQVAIAAAHQTVDCTRCTLRHAAERLDCGSG